MAICTNRAWHFRFIVLLTGFALFAQLARAQDSSTVEKSSRGRKAWEGNASLNAYFLQDGFYMIPVLTADKNRLHLEARYNYEDFRTFSAWGGYNFTGGKKLEWDLTPMLGLVLGQTNAIAPGLEMLLSYGKLEFYSEGEWLFNIEDKYDDFVYFWSDLGYSPWAWLTIGLSAQRTRSYQSGRDVQKGLLIGLSRKKASLNGYFYNIGAPASSFFLLTASIGF